MWFCMWRFSACHRTYIALPVTVFTFSHKSSFLMCWRGQSALHLVNHRLVLALGVESIAFLCDGHPNVGEQDVHALPLLI